MPRLEGVSTDALRRELHRQDRAKPTRRLMVAIAHKEGVSQSELAEWYGLSRKTVHNWLERLEERPIADAIEDDPRPGRPPRLDGADREELREILAESPTEQGYDETEWSPPLVRRLLAERFEAEYTLRSVRRILGDFGTNPGS